MESSLGSSAGDDSDVYEVEAILDQRKHRGRREYLVKWLGWDESTNTWEPARNINRSDLDTFLGKPAPSRKRQRGGEPILPARGAGCARAQLSGTLAANFRGLVLGVISDIF